MAPSIISSTKLRLFEQTICYIKDTGEEGKSNKKMSFAHKRAVTAKGFSCCFIN